MRIQLGITTNGGGSRGPATLHAFPFDEDDAAATESVRLLGGPRVRANDGWATLCGKDLPINFGWLDGAPLPPGVTWCPTCERLYSTPPAPTPSAPVTTEASTITGAELAADAIASVEKHAGEAWMIDACAAIRAYAEKHEIVISDEIPMPDPHDRRARGAAMAAMARAGVLEATDERRAHCAANCTGSCCWCRSARAARIWRSRLVKT